MNLETELKQNQIEDLLIMESALKLYRNKLKDQLKASYSFCTTAEHAIIKENLEFKLNHTERLIKDTQTKITQL